MIPHPALRRSWSLLLPLLAACGAPPEPPEPEAARLRSLLVDQTAIGPRPVGTDEHARLVSWLRRTLENRADTVLADSFTVPGEEGEPLRAVNLLARFRPEREARVLLVAHVDPPALADRSGSAAERREPAPGAGDPASGVAVLLELAELFRAAPPAVGVDMLFADAGSVGGEEAGGEEVSLGTRRFVERHDAGTWRWALVVDRVSDVAATFPTAPRSDAALAARLRATAAGLGLAPFFPDSVGPPVRGDHVPLVEAGVPTVAVIDPELGPGDFFRRSVDDLPGTTDPETMRAVARVVDALVRSER